MRTPSWIELVGRNAAAESVYLTGTLEVGESPSDSLRFDFHHAPGEKWRIEHEGLPVYIASAKTTVVRIDDQMQRLDGDIQLPILGAQFNPLNLLGSASLLHNMSSGMKADGPASPIDAGGRAAWSIRLLTPGDEQIVMTFDDATGLLVRVENCDGIALLQVSNLAEPESLPDSLFVWEGPVQEARPSRRGRRDPQQSEDERIEFMRAVVTAHERSHEVLDAIANSDGESAARAALVQLLGVTEFGADAIMATPLSQFRGDHAAGNRRTLEVMEQRRRQ